MSKLTTDEIQAIGRDSKRMFAEALAEVESTSKELDKLSAERAANKRGYVSGGYTNHNPDPVSAWLFSERQLTFWERCYVGFSLWYDGVGGRLPWPVDQVRQ